MTRAEVAMLKRWQKVGRKVEVESVCGADAVAVRLSAERAAISGGGDALDLWRQLQWRAGSVRQSRTGVDGRAGGASSSVWMQCAPAASRTGHEDWGGGQWGGARKSR